MRLAIVTTHPVQYNAPLFKLLAAQPGVQLKVFYTWSQAEAGAKFDPDFGKVISWDIPLLDGYDYVFVNNVAADPGSHHFNGIQNPTLIREICDWHPEAILVFGWSYRSHLACMRYFKGRVPVLFRGDSTLLNEQPGPKRMMRWIFLRWVYRYVDFALYVGKHNKAYYRAHGMTESQLVFAPHAVDNERFSVDNPMRDVAAIQRREALGIREKDMVVLFAGKLEERKDPFFVLRLARQLQRPGLVYLIVGNGPLEPAMKNQAMDLPGVIFMDFQNQQSMPEIYRMGDVFLLPSVSETWGLAINEAMACSRPVIVSTRVGCAPDLVEHGKTGWIFDPGERALENVVSVLEQLYMDRQLMKEVGIQAFQKVQSYSFGAIIGAVTELMKAISPEKGSVPPELDVRS
jgi:glycosyltransferase involved in cell wall biosynthesis